MTSRGGADGLRGRLGDPSTRSERTGVAAWIASRSRTSIAVAVLLLGFLAIVLSQGMRFPPPRSGDSLALINGTRVASECIDEGVWKACGRLGESRLTDVTQFPLLQYLPAFVLVQLGASDGQIVEWFERISAAAFVLGGVTLAYVVRRTRGRAWAAISVVIVISGYWLHYAFSSFGESLVAALCLAFIAAVALRAPPAVVFAAALFASLGKETLPPFIIVLGCVCGRGEEDGWLPPRSLLVPLVAGSGVAAALAAAFNYFRFGTLANLVYSDPLVRVPDLTTRSKNAAALWLSPNGGMAWFWTSLTLLVVLSFVVLLLQVLRAPRAVREWGPTAVVLGLLAAQTAGHASWHAPFGWFAWGPRLSLPLVPALAFALIHTGGRAIDEALAWIVGSLTRLAATTLIVVITAWPQVGVIWNPAASAAINVSDEVCYRQNAAMLEDIGYYYRCLLHVAWRTSPWTLWDAVRYGGPGAWMAQGILTPTVFLLFLDARRHAHARPIRDTSHLRSPVVGNGRWIESR